MADGSKIELGSGPGALTPAPPQELRATSPSTIKIELDGPGGGFMERLGASMPSTAEGKVRFLEGLYGAGRVKTTSDGTILVPTKDGHALMPFDPKTFSLSTIADFAGPAMPALGGFGGAMLGEGAASPFTAAAGAAAGSAVRNAAAEALTGGTGRSALDIATDVATEGAIGGLSQGMFSVGAKVFDTVFRPHNWLARAVNSKMAKPFAQEGQRLSDVTGIPLTPGEATGSRAFLQGEAFARRTPGGADTVFEFEQGRLGTVLAKLRDVTDQFVAPNAKVGGTFKVGTDVIDTFEEALDQATKLRRVQASVDFGEVTRASNGVPVIPTSATVRAMQQLVDELDVPGAGDATQGVVNSAKGALKSLLGEDGTPRRLTGEQAQRLLQVYTDAQRGTGVIFRDMEKGQSRLIAGRVKDALLQDLDQAVGEAGDAGAVALALTTARNNYRLNSEAVNEVTNSTLARLIGNGTRAPEAIAEKLIRMYPSEIKDVMQLVDRASPETGEAVRRLFIEDAIRNAAPPVTDRAAAGVRFSAGRFLKTLPDNDTLRAAGFSDQSLFEIGQIAKVLERVADKAYEGSPTAFAQIAWDAVKGLFGVMTPTGAIQTGVALLAPAKLAKAITTPEGRAALRTLTNTSSTAKAIGGATTALFAITGTEPGGEDVRPLLAPILPTNRTLENAFQ